MVTYVSQNDSSHCALEKEKHFLNWQELNLRVSIYAGELMASYQHKLLKSEFESTFCVLGLLVLSLPDEKSLARRMNVFWSVLSLPKRSNFLTRMSEPTFLNHRTWNNCVVIAYRSYHQPFEAIWWSIGRPLGPTWEVCRALPILAAYPFTPHSISHSPSCCAHLWSCNQHGCFIHISPSCWNMLLWAHHPRPCQPCAFFLLKPVLWGLL